MGGGDQTKKNLYGGGGGGGVWIFLGRAHSAQIVRAYSAFLKFVGVLFLFYFILFH